MIGLLLVVVVSALLIAWAGAAGLGLLGRCAPFMFRAGRRPSTALRAATVLGPVLLALLAVLVILVPTPLQYCHCFTHGDHHPHLCVYHPWLASPLLGAALPVAALWLAFASWRCGPVVRELFRAEAWAKRLRLSPSETFDGVRVRVVDDLALGAFTVGMWRPVIVVDRLLWERLDPRERLAVIHHEHAHAERRDALTLACLRLVSAALPWPSMGSWLRAWKSATETLCDRYAAARVQDATCVAMALVSVERLRASIRASRALAPALGIAAGTDLEARVRALLDDDGRAQVPLANDLLAVGISLTGLAALALVLPGSTLHHAAESLLGLFASLTH
jgi:Zn-dependent protease with chaperone function